MQNSSARPCFEGSLMPPIWLYIQGIIKTEMELVIRFWAPNLGLSPKYD